MVSWERGDIGAERNGSFLARLIQFGQLLYGDRNWRWNHIFVVTDSAGSTVEAVGKGVCRGTVAGRDVVKLRFPEGVDREKVAAFAESKLGVKYDYWDDVLLGVDCLPPKTQFHTADGDRLICSELGAEALAAGGWVSPKLPALTKPGDLVDELGTADPIS